MPAFRVDDIVVPDRKRSGGDVRGLCESIEKIGLLNPITVVVRDIPDGSPGGHIQRPVLVAGLNRLEAFKKLGKEEIPAQVVSHEGLEKELAEIDENLIRDELTALERAEHLERRKSIFDMMGSGTNCSETPPQGGRPEEFATKTSEETGVTKQDINRAIRRANKIAPDVKEEIADTPIADSGVELDALAKADPKDQRIAVKRVKEGKAKTVRDALPKKQGPSDRLKTAQRAYMRLNEKERQQFHDWLEQ
jgi:ParB family chromosome partitioning protein